MYYSIPIYATREEFTGSD